MDEVLLVSIGFSPNVGGIETHFDDLTKALDKRNWKVWVLTYKPITTNVKARCFEKRGKNIIIYRIPWIRGVFYSLVSKPLLEFIFLTPSLFLVLPIFLILKGKNIKVIHSHGLIAGFVSVFWGKLFGKKVITTTHSIYNFPNQGMYNKFARWIFNRSDIILTLSKQSKEEIIALDINKNKVKVFTYWIDLEKFKNIPQAKEKIGIRNDFVVFYASRLVPEKGIRELLDAAGDWNKKIGLIIASDGPLRNEVLIYQKKFNNISYVGKLTQEQLPLYYSAADIVIIPSTHEEGFGRVILESLACSTPVIGSNRGAIPEAINKSVGKLIDITPDKIRETVEYFYKNSNELKNLSYNTRKYAEKRYSERNLIDIIKFYG